MTDDQVPATWFLVTQDPPPGVTPTAPLPRGAVFVLLRHGDPGGNSAFGAAFEAAYVVTGAGCAAAGP